MSLTEAVKKSQQRTLSVKGGVSLFVGGLLVYWLFFHWGRFDLARPTLASAFIIGVAIEMKWELRGHFWFWATVTVIAALHVLLICSVAWTATWIPVFVIIPIGIADYGAILWAFATVGKVVKRAKASHG